MQWDKIEEYAQYILNKSQDRDDVYLHEMCWKLVVFTKPCAIDRVTKIPNDEIFG